MELELDQMMATVLEQRQERVGTDKNDNLYPTHCFISGVNF